MLRAPLLVALAAAALVAAAVRAEDDDDDDAAETDEAEWRCWQTRGRQQKAEPCGRPGAPQPLGKASCLMERDEAKGNWTGYACDWGNLCGNMPGQLSLGGGCWVRGAAPTRSWTCCCEGRDCNYDLSAHLYTALGQH